MHCTHQPHSAWGGRSQRRSSCRAHPAGLFQRAILLPHSTGWRALLWRGQRGQRRLGCLHTAQGRGTQRNGWHRGSRLWCALRAALARGFHLRCGWQSPLRWALELHMGCGEPPHPDGNPPRSNFRRSASRTAAFLLRLRQSAVPQGSAAMESRHLRPSLPTKRFFLPTKDGTSWRNSAHPALLQCDSIRRARTQLAGSVTSAFALIAAFDIGRSDPLLGHQPCHPELKRRIPWTVRQAVVFRSWAA